MPRDVRGEVPIIFADTGDVAPPDVANFNEGYELSFEQTGGKKPTREGTNKIYQQLYAMGKDISQYGAILPYSQTIDFLVDAVVTEAGALFICTQLNGPDSVVRIPGVGGSEAFWDDLRVTEQGTEINFTPRLSDEDIGGNLATISNASGRSLQIGDMVTVVIAMEGIDKTGMNGANKLKMQGLPVAINPDFGASAVTFSLDVSFSGRYMTTVKRSGGNDTVLSFRDVSTTVLDDLIISDIQGTNADIIFSVSYIAL